MCTDACKSERLTLCRFTSLPNHTPASKEHRALCRLLREMFPEPFHSSPQRRLVHPSPEKPCSAPSCLPKRTRGALLPAHSLGQAGLLPAPGTPRVSSSGVSAHSPRVRTLLRWVLQGQVTGLCVLGRGPGSAASRPAAHAGSNIWGGRHISSPSPSSYSAESLFSRR